MSSNSLANQTYGSPLTIEVDVHAQFILKHVRIEDDPGVALETFADHPPQRNASPGGSYWRGALIQRNDGLTDYAGCCLGPNHRRRLQLR
jgi:hypothetical protein